MYITSVLSPILFYQFILALLFLKNFSTKNFLKYSQALLVTIC